MHTLLPDCLDHKILSHPALFVGVIRIPQPIIDLALYFEALIDVREDFIPGHAAVEELDEVFFSACHEIQIDYPRVLLPDLVDERFADNLPFIYGDLRHRRHFNSNIPGDRTAGHGDQSKGACDQEYGLHTMIIKEIGEMWKCRRRTAGGRSYFVILQIFFISQK